jgi:lysyl-tRNA synthetase class 2
VLDELKKKLKDCTKGDILNAVFEAYVEVHLFSRLLYWIIRLKYHLFTKKKNDDPTMTESLKHSYLPEKLPMLIPSLMTPLTRRKGSSSRQMTRSWRRRGICNG